MAINPTRGLPSFSEMYEAFKNRGSLGDTLQAGLQGYVKGTELKNAQTKTEAEAEYHRAAAKKALADAAKPKEGFIRIDQIIDPKEKADLAQYASPNAEGVLVVPQSTYNAVTKRSQGAENLDLKNQLATQGAEHQAALIKAAQEKQALLNEIGPKAQAISAAKGLAESAGKVDEPSILGRVISPIKEKITGQPLASVLAERQREAANARLQSLMSNAQGATIDKTTGIQPAPSNGPGSPSNPIPVSDTEAYNALPIGAYYIDSSGNTKVKGR